MHNFVQNNVEDLFYTRDMKTLTDKAEYRTLRELGGLECLKATYFRQHFSRHTHEGYTIGVIHEGAQRFLRGHDKYVAPSDSIILVNHDQVHDGHSATTSHWSYDACYPTLEQLQQVLCQAGYEWPGSIYFPDPVVYDPELAGVLRHTFLQLYSTDNDLLRETLLYNALLLLIERHAQRLPQPKEMPAARQKVERIREFLADYPQQNVSLEDLSEMAEMSAWHLVKQFRHYIGLPPHAYQIQQRLRLAKQYLRQGTPLLDAALAAGFHDQSHMNRYFKRVLGVTPGQFRKGLYCQ